MNALPLERKRDAVPRRSGFPLKATAKMVQFGLSAAACDPFEWKRQRMAIAATVPLENDAIRSGYVSKRPDVDTCSLKTQRSWQWAPTWLSYEQESPCLIAALGSTAPVRRIRLWGAESFWKWRLSTVPAGWRRSSAPVRGSCRSGHSPCRTDCGRQAHREVLADVVVHPQPRRGMGPGLVVDWGEAVGRGGIPLRTTRSRHGGHRSGPAGALGRAGARRTMR